MSGTDDKKFGGKQFVLKFSQNFILYDGGEIFSLGILEQGSFSESALDNFREKLRKHRS